MGGQLQDKAGDGVQRGVEGGYDVDGQGSGHRPAQAAEARAAQQQRVRTAAEPTTASRPNANSARLSSIRMRISWYAALEPLTPAPVLSAVTLLAPARCSA